MLEMLEQSKRRWREVGNVARSGWEKARKEFEGKIGEWDVKKGEHYSMQGNTLSHESSLARKGRR